MLEGLHYLVSRRPLWLVLRDVSEVLLVAFITYRALLVLRGTRAQQMTVGLAVIGAAYLGARWLGLTTIVNLLEIGFANLPILLVVVFQNDIRRALMRVGDRRWLAGFSGAQETKLVDEVVAAATELARHRMGALIAFEQNATLDEFVVGHGIPLDARVTRELLVTVFQPEAVNKLHDGAVVIRGLRVVNAGVFFPMPEARNLDPSLGSRHRAALGITDETDAIVVVVSEERGSITVAYRGNMIQNLDGPKLQGVLLDLLGYRAPKKRKEPPPESRREASGSISVRLTNPPPPMVPSSRGGAKDKPRDEGPTSQPPGTRLASTPLGGGEGS